MLRVFSLSLLLCLCIAFSVPFQCVFLTDVQQYTWFSSITGLWLLVVLWFRQSTGFVNAQLCFVQMIKIPHCRTDSVLFRLTLWLVFNYAVVKYYGNLSGYNSEIL